jgi:uncharacterized membrane protein YfcA
MQTNIACAALIVGFVIGLTGMGGGALMTPVLVILFHVNPLAAISNDVLASVVLKPIGGNVHARRGTVNWTLVRWLAVGSVPAAFAGAYVISRVTGAGAEDTVKHLLGWVLLVAAAGMLVKTIAQTRRRALPTGERMDAALVRPIPTVIIGLIGGFAVGLTSVGSGSLMIVMLMFLYPKLSAREMVGTDLVQAIPLVAAAAIGHLIFGDLQFGLTGSVLVGAIPGVYVGARISATASDRFIRPALIAVLTISSLKLIGASNGVLLGALIVSVVLIATYFFLDARRRRLPVADPKPAVSPRP